MEFEELVGHLDDLIDLARSERFRRFADVLKVSRDSLTLHRDTFEVRDGEPPTTIDPSQRVSGQPCGCDPGAGWICEWHQRP
jgi:hypothetical protein